MQFSIEKRIKEGTKETRLRMGKTWLALVKRQGKDEPWKR